VGNKSAGVKTAAACLGELLLIREKEAKQGSLFETTLSLKREKYRSAKKRVKERVLRYYITNYNLQTNISFSSFLGAFIDSKAFPCQYCTLCCNDCRESSIGIHSQSLLWVREWLQFCPFPDRKLNCRFICAEILSVRDFTSFNIYASGMKK